MTSRALVTEAERGEDYCMVWRALSVSIADMHASRQSRRGGRDLGATMSVARATGPMNHDTTVTGRMLSRPDNTIGIEASKSCSCELATAAAATRRDFWRSKVEWLQCRRTQRMCGDAVPMPLLSSSAAGCAHCEDAEAQVRLIRLDEDALRWRKDAGRLSCELDGRGPTGGFCMYGRSPPNSGLDSELSEALATTLVNSTVLDLGCGMGLYGRYFREHAPTLRWTGVDGSEGIEEATNGLVTFADLAADGLPRALRRPWDWTMSVQVAEHIPPRAEAAFMHTLAVHAQRGVVLLWAQLGQHGLMHANCQKPEYVACAMRFLGFDEAGPPQVRTRGVFLRRRGAPQLPPHPDANFVAAYRSETRVRCGYTTWGYLTGSARAIRQLAARRAVLGVPLHRRVCDDSVTTTNWRHAIHSDEQHVQQLARATVGGENGVERDALALYEALAVDEVSPANKAAMRNLSRLGPPGRGTVVASPMALSAQNATMATWRAWLNNIVWGLCVPPTEGFCSYSRLGRNRRHCVQ